MRLACTSCTWLFTIALLCGGALLMTLATLWLGDLVAVGWHAGCVAKVIAFSLFSSAPIVALIAWTDYRSTRSEESLKKRLGCLGVSLAVLGTLELALALFELFILAVIGAIYIF